MTYVQPLLARFEELDGFGVLTPLTAERVVKEWLADSAAADKAEVDR